MDRRFFLATCIALAAPATALAAGGLRVDYTPEAYARALASGEPLLLDFYAPW